MPKWLFDFLPSCGGCENSSFHFVCENCRERLRFPRALCGACLSAPCGTSGLCESCESHWPVKSLHLSYVYEAAIQSWIEALKFEAWPSLHRELNRLWLTEEVVNWPIEAVTTVPNDPTQSRQRGFDLSTLWGRRLSRLLKKPNLSAFARVEFLRPLKALRASERELILPQILTLQAQKPLPRRILLFDDVMTTGASLRRAAQDLQAQGIEVYVWVIARQML